MRPDSGFWSVAALLVMGGVAGCGGNTPQATNEATAPAADTSTMAPASGPASAMTSTNSSAPTVVPVALGSAPKPTDSAPHADKFGIELDGPLEGSRMKMFVDLGKIFRPMTLVGSDKPAPTDAKGWPTSDAQTVFFDIRPFGAWAPPMDDPAKFQPDWSGIYKMSFNGQAELKPFDATNMLIAGQRYNAAKNLTTVDLVVPKGAGLMALQFIKTKRTASSAPNTGITNIKVIRPGYALNTKEIFTREFLNSLKPFTVLRYMDVLSTNHQPGFYKDPGHHVLEWSGRRLPTDATQADVGGKFGVAWEYIIALANQTGRDLWINIPVEASDDYVTQLAALMKKSLTGNQKIYIEHSNEVWNFAFPQYIYNKLAAVDEVKKGGSTLNNDGSKDEEVWARRRHAKRVVEIGNIFKKAFSGEASSRIFPVYAAWVINPKDYYENVLAWVNKTYGPPKNFFYGIAGAAYYNAEKASPTATVAQVLEAIHQNSRDNDNAKKEIQAVANKYGVKHLQYEVGPDVGGGKVENVANRILANRDPGMKDIIVDDATRWFGMGGDIYMYFSLCSPYSRYGAWGLSEDIKDLNTPKWQAIYQLTGTQPPAKQ